MLLPLYVLGLCAAFQVRVPWRLRTSRRWAMVVGSLLLIVLATNSSAMKAPFDLAPIAVMLTPPVLVHLGLFRRLERIRFTILVKGSVLITALLAALAGYQIITTPILPLTAVEISTQGSPAPQQLLRGYIISEDESLTTILREDGGVAIIERRDIIERISCLVPREQSRYRLVAGLALDESVLQRFAKSQRETGPPDPRCIRPVSP